MTGTNGIRRDDGVVNGMSSEEPKVDELKRLLRRLEKIESLTEIEAPESARSVETPRPPTRQDALASLRTPLPSSQAFFHAPPPMPDPTSDLPPGLLATPASLPRPQPIAPAPVEKGRQRTVLLFLFLMLAVMGGAVALLLSGQLDQPQRVAMRTPTVPSPANPAPAATEAPPPPVAATAVAIAVAPEPAEKPAPAPVAIETSPPAAPNVLEAPAAPPEWAKSASATPVAGLEGADADMVVPSSPFASRETWALTNEPPALEARPFVVPVPVPAVPPQPPVAVLQPPTPTPALAPPSAPAPEPAPQAAAAAEPAVPSGPRLLAGDSLSVPPGIRVTLPVKIEPEAAAEDHYVLIIGLEPDSYVSRAVEVIGGTWMIRGTDLGAAQLERSANPPKRIEADVQLRANSGEIVSRTPLTVLAE